MSTRACPDWPQLMEIAPELHFKHYTPHEAELPVSAMTHLGTGGFDTIAICCDLERHVFNPDHTDLAIAEALRASHWFDLREWSARAPQSKGY